VDLLLAQLSLLVAASRNDAEVAQSGGVTSLTRMPDLATARAIAKIAYDASVRALVSQEGQLSGLHVRASFLLAAAGVATATVLGRAGGQVNRAGVTAVIFFAATAIIAAWILLPRRDAWKFTSNAAIILDEATSRPNLTEKDVLDWVGRANQANYVENKRLLDWLHKLLTSGCVTLFFAITAAAVSLAS
jgi:hypothetical protein